MEKEIQNLIIKYMMEGKKADVAYYNEIVSLYLKHHNLEGFIHPNVVVADVEGIIAAFMPQQKVIVVSPNGIEEIKNTLSKIKKYQFNGEYFNVLEMLQITQYLLHELEHVLQESKIVNGEEKTVEDKLLQITNPTWYTIKKLLEQQGYDDDFIELSILEKIEEFNELYQTKLYPIVLRERLAEIRSHKTILNILPNLNLPEVFTNFYSDLLQFEYLRGYDLNGNVTPGPTMNFIDALAGIKIIDPTKCEIYDDNKIITYLKTKDELTLEERIELGLPLLKDEYEALSLGVTIKIPETVCTQK